jgi:fumarylacetoacetase
MKQQGLSPELTCTVESEKYHLTRCNTKNVVFSFAQMLAHHTAGGCPMQPGDLIATGTLSGATQPELGCLLEASWNGTRQCTASTKAGAESKSINRVWLQDGDIVQYTAQALPKDGLGRVGFGECSGEILASI